MSAILFLTMLLLGLGVSYLCLRRRASPPPRRLIDDSSASIISRETIQGARCRRRAGSSMTPRLVSSAGRLYKLSLICAILFLTMLLLGLGVSYLCLRRRALPPPRRLIDDSSASIISRETIQGTEALVMIGQ
ncbi:unnamed protein product [Plutella xylostella]|uniref:(diamondback moth) hypothetical protein n=1 Tax=Plutella xylostella TaxID=51655 RepID=A0A8S4E447_PLUXY|nr:unnamed protein product [Plutella xylostella]